MLYALRVKNKMKMIVIVKLSLEWLLVAQRHEPEIAMNYNRQFKDNRQTHLSQLHMKEACQPCDAACR